MAGQENGFSDAGDERLPHDLTIPDGVPAEVVEAEQKSRSADLGVALARVAFQVVCLGVRPNESKYFEPTLDYSWRRRIVVESGLSNIRLFVNDEGPHPEPLLHDILTLRMATYVVSEGRIVCRSSTADRVAGEEQAWQLVGGVLVGPYIGYDKEMGAVDVRGRKSHLTPHLPTSPPPEELISSTKHASNLVDIVMGIRAIDEVEGVTIFIQPSDVTPKSDT